MYKDVLHITLYWYKNKTMYIYICVCDDDDDDDDELLIKCGTKTLNKIGKDCCEQQNPQVLGKNNFIRIVSYYLPSQESFLTHVMAPRNYTTSIICLHLPYICPITHICFQHLPSLPCIDCTD